MVRNDLSSPRGDITYFPMYPFECLNVLFSNCVYFFYIGVANVAGRLHYNYVRMRLFIVSRRLEAFGSANSPRPAVCQGLSHPCCIYMNGFSLRKAQCGRGCTRVKCNGLFFWRHPNERGWESWKDFFLIQTSLQFAANFDSDVFLRHGKESDASWYLRFKVFYAKRASGSFCLLRF